MKNQIQNLGLGLVIYLSILSSDCKASERMVQIPKDCNTFDSCYAKSGQTDVYRNKIRYIDGAIHYWSEKDGESRLYTALVEKADYTIREAGGDTGYKGTEINLRVNHKKEYRKIAYQSAIQDLSEALKNSKYLGDKKQSAESLLREAKAKLKEVE